MGSATSTGTHKRTRDARGLDPSANAFVQELDPGAADVGTAPSDHSVQPPVAGTYTKVVHSWLDSHFSTQGSCPSTVPPTSTRPPEAGSVPW